MSERKCTMDEENLGADVKIENKKGENNMHFTDDEEGGGGGGGGGRRRRRRRRRREGRGGEKGMQAWVLGRS